MSNASVMRNAAQWTLPCTRRILLSSSRNTQEARNSPMWWKDPTCSALIIQTIPQLWLRMPLAKNGQSTHPSSHLTHMRTRHPCKSRRMVPMQTNPGGALSVLALASASPPNKDMDVEGPNPCITSPTPRHVLTIFHFPAGSSSQRLVQAPRPVIG